MKSTSLQASVYRWALHLSAISVIERIPFFYQKFYRLQYSLNREAKLKEKYVKKNKLSDETQRVELYKLSKIRDFSESKIIFYIHGGAFTMNITQAHFSFCKALNNSLSGSVITYFPIYSLAPIKTFSEIFEECLYCYKQVVNDHPGSPIYLIGDSAGGMLALNLINYLKITDAFMPSSIILISPWLDGHFKLPVSMSLQKKDKMLGLGYMKLIAKEIDDLTDSPHLSMDCFKFDYESFPRILIVGGEAEILAPSYRAFSHKLQNIHSEILTSYLMPNMQHVSTLFQFIPESREAMIKIKDFIEQS